MSFAALVEFELERVLVECFGWSLPSCFVGADSTAAGSKAALAALEAPCSRGCKLNRQTGRRAGRGCADGSLGTFPPGTGDHAGTAEPAAASRLSGSQRPHLADHNSFGEFFSHRRFQMTLPRGYSAQSAFLSGAALDGYPKSTFFDLASSALTPMYQTFSFG